MKRFILFGLLVTAFFGAVCSTQGQEFRNITGFVKDQYLVPLGGVTISAGTAVTQTDMAGYFMLTVPAGVYSVRAQVTGFETSTIMVDVTISDVEIVFLMEKESEQEEEPGVPGFYDVEFELQSLYLPARIAIQFLYTLNFSISNVRTLGQSLWTATTSPIGIEFHASHVDTYEFDLILRYGEITEQVVQVGIWSGTLAPNSIPLRFTKKLICIHFRLVCTEEPRPPTPEEIAEQVLIATRQDLQYYYDQITLLTRQFEENLLTQWVMVGATIIFSIVSLIISAYVLRTKSHQTSEGG